MLQILYPSSGQGSCLPSTDSLMLSGCILNTITNGATLRKGCPSPVLNSPLSPGLSHLESPVGDNQRKDKYFKINQGIASPPLLLPLPNLQARGLPTTACLADELQFSNPAKPAPCHPQTHTLTLDPFTSAKLNMIPDWRYRGGQHSSPPLTSEHSWVYVDVCNSSRSFYV